MSDKTYASLNTLKIFLDNIKILMDNHNTTTDSHNDIRNEIEDIATRLSALADCDDETLDQISEIVQYIKDNRELIQQITTAKVSVSDIINNLTTNVIDKPLSAAQGVVLKNMITELDEIADYIIECGTASGWNYEKWNSGKYILTRVYKETLTHYTTVGGFYGFVSSEIYYPITFNELPVFYYNAKVANGFAIPAGDVQTKTTSCRCYALSTASGECACTFEIRVEGKWR